jgi:hypothetical protein
VAYWHGIRDGQPCVSFQSGSRWLTVTVQGNSGSVTPSGMPCKSPIPLYAEPYVSLPPLDAIFLLGSDRVGRFLARNHWSRNEPFNHNFPGQAAHEYETLWRRNCPLYRDDIAGALGGWNMPWPDGDFEALISCELLIWTIEEAEPWVEVFETGGSFQVFQRIT